MIELSRLEELKKINLSVRADWADILKLEREVIQLYKEAMTDFINFLKENDSDRYVHYENELDRNTRLPGMKTKTDNLQFIRTLIAKTENTISALEYNQKLVGWLSIEENQKMIEVNNKRSEEIRKTDILSLFREYDKKAAYLIKEVFDKVDEKSIKVYNGEITFKCSDGGISIHFYPRYDHERELYVNAYNGNFYYSQEYDSVYQVMRRILSVEDGQYLLKFKELLSDLSNGLDALYNEEELCKAFLNTHTLGYFACSEEEYALA